MNILLKVSMVIIASLSFFLISCNDNDDEPNPSNSNEDVVLEIPTGEGANDESARNEVDNSTDDVFDILRSDFGQSLRNGRLKNDSGVVLPCGVATLDSSQNGRISINYSESENCGSKVLSGSITMASNNNIPWDSVGSILDLIYTNYTVKYNANGETIRYNGTLQLRNVTGYDIGNLIITAGVDTVIHEITGSGFQVTFVDSNNVTTTRSWDINKQRRFTDTDNTVNTVAWEFLEGSQGAYWEQGISKDGHNFTTTIDTPLRWENCDNSGQIDSAIYRLKEGKWIYTIPNNSLTATAGYFFSLSDSTGTLVGNCTSNSYRLDYNINGQTNFTRYQLY